MTRVAVVGVGAMGSRMALRLVDAGFSVVVWNRDPGKAAAFDDVAATPAAAAGRADVVLVMVSDPAALRAVTEGPDGIAAGASAGSVVVQMSTVGPAALSRLASVLPAGVELVDAPVLGSRAEAEAGTLTIFVGGSAAAVERLAPVLEALGTPLHVGRVGAASAAKLVANFTLVGTIALLGEALALAEGLGLSRELAFEVLSTTPLAAQAERRREAIEDGGYSPRFPLSLALKDARLIGEAADAAGVDLRVGAAAGSWLADADADGYGELDYAAVLARILGVRPSSS